ncbi:MAG: methylmalonyl Co-A mutase-associated GTPase MeaB [Clostridia bacterium]|nr:methylmalonyl Co-A mutase-associated GTPase MeaB [Clostridia bacterium]
MQTGYKEHIAKMLDGNIYSLAKVISMAETDPINAGEIMQHIFPHCKPSFIIGITGPPGAGKSSVIFQLARHLSSLNKKVAVLAIDPNSHLTGGALLGDRIRMDDLSDVYIRSIGNQCATGGIAVSAYFVTKILEACKYEFIFIETVGAGQSEIKVKDISDIAMLVLAPGFGDDIQANKAGIMEIGNVFIVNKADKPDSLRLEVELIDMLKSVNEDTDCIHIFRTDCINGNGFDSLIEYLIEESKAKKNKNEHSKIKTQLIELAQSKANKIIENRINSLTDIDTLLDGILSGKTNITDIIDSNVTDI